MDNMTQRSTLATTATEPFTTLITVAGEHEHRFVADAHVSEGGQGQGATPHELLESALAGCMSITAKMYAKRKEWPLESVSVRVRHDHRAGADSGEKAHFFDIQITLTGDLTDEQRQRIYEIANRCPVHKILESGAQFSAELTSG